MTGPTRALVVCLLVLAGCATAHYRVGDGRTVGATEAEQTFVMRNLQVGGRTGVSPGILRAPMPDYPRDARRAGHHGRVLVRFDVREDGRTDRFHIVESPSEDLDEAVLAAVRQWEFVPFKKDGVPVRVTCEIPFAFELR